MSRLELWTWYAVRFFGLTNLCSSVPLDPAIVQKWLEARAPRVRPPGARSIEETNEEVLASLERGEGEPDTGYSQLVFQRHAGACVMRAATVRAHIKDCAGVLSRDFIGTIEKERRFVSRVKNDVYHDPGEYWLPIRRPDGAVVTAADGSYEKPIHVQTRMGPMNAIKVFEYISAPWVLEFKLKVLNAQVRRATTKDDGTKETTVTLMPSVPEDDLHLVFEYGGTHGYGGERGDGEGRYTYELARIEAPTGADRTGAADTGAAGTPRGPAPRGRAAGAHPRAVATHK